MTEKTCKTLATVGAAIGTAAVVVLAYEMLWGDRGITPNRKYVMVPNPELQKTQFYTVRRQPVPSR